MSSTIAGKFALATKQAREELKRLLIEAVESGKIDHAKINAAAVAAGVTQGGVTVLLSRLEDRKTHAETHKAREWGREIDEAKRERIESQAEIDELVPQLERLQKAVGEAHERNRRAMEKVNKLINDRDQDSREFALAMKKTAGSGQDPLDWRNIDI